MAYDLLFRRLTPSNCTFRTSFTNFEFSPEPTQATPDEQQFIAALAVLKMAAESGNKKKLKEWRATQAKLAAVRKKASKGDLKAQHLVTVLNESGLFATGVQSMSITSGRK